MNYLAATEQVRGNDWPVQARQVIAAGGPGVWRQLGQILWLRLARTGLSPDEYYSCALWKGPLTRDRAASFVPNSKRTGYIKALLLPGGDCQAPEIADKLRTEVLLRAAGHPTVRSGAVLRSEIVPEGAAVLETEADIAAFLSDPARFPLFVKPAVGSLSFGSIALTGTTGPDLQVLNRGTIPVAGLAAELAATAGPYIFQPLVPMHPDLGRHTGGAVPAIRIVTLRTGRGPAPHYAVLRMPSRTAMHDGASRNPRLWAGIDLDTGRPGPMRYLGNPGARPPTHWGDPETPLAELVLPHWKAAVDLCVAAHDHFPLNGFLGWDIFLTPDGPLINEVNGMAYPIYQPATGEGLRQGRFEALYQEALAHVASVTGADPGRRS